MEKKCTVSDGSHCISIVRRCRGVRSKKTATKGYRLPITESAQGTCGSIEFRGIAQSERSRRCLPVPKGLVEEAMNRVAGRCWVGAFLLMAMLGRLSTAVAAVNTASGESSMPFGQDLQGRALQRLAPPGTRAVVLYFAATDCPISNRYLPEIARLDGVFRQQGVLVLSVYPNSQDTREVVATHDRQFGATGQTLIDPQQRLVDLARARMTPEAAVLVPNGAGWHVVYLGRIDDRYLSLGKERPSATRHDLEDAVRATLAHRPVPSPGGPPVGCAIVPLSQ